MWRFIYIIFFIACFDNTCAQQRIDWTKYDALTFKQDTIQGFPLFNEESDLLYPINKSTARLEIRLYRLAHAGVGTIYTIRSYNDSFIFNEILGRSDSTFLNGSVYNGGKKYFKKGNYLGYYWQIFKNTIYVKPENLLDDLIRQGLFVSDDLNAGKENLRKRNRHRIGNKMNTKTDSLSGFQVWNDFVVEVKFNDKFRRFGIYRIKYYDANGNSDFMMLGNELLKIFTDLFEKSKLKIYETAY